MKINNVLAIQILNRKKLLQKGWLHIIETCIFTEKVHYNNNVQNANIYLENTNCEHSCQ